MSQRSKRIALFALVAVLVCVVALACGGGTDTEPTSESDQPPVASTKEGSAAGEEPVEEPEGGVEDASGSEQVPSQPALEGFSIQAAEALAPISILSRVEPPEAEDETFIQFELDRAGNLHVLICWGRSDCHEIYVVDGVVYARDHLDRDFFVSDDAPHLELLVAPFDLFSVREELDDLIEVSPLHGILWFAAYESVEVVGSETVNTFSTDKYRLVIDAEELLDHSAAWEVAEGIYEVIQMNPDNAAVDVWVEPTSGAIVKAEWTLVHESDGETETAVLSLEVTPLGDTLFEAPPVSQ